MQYYKVNYKFSCDLKNGREVADVFKRISDETFNDLRDYNYFVYDMDYKSKIINCCIIFNQEKITARKASELLAKTLENSNEDIKRFEFISDSLEEVTAEETDECSYYTNQYAEHHIINKLNRYGHFDYYESNIVENILPKQIITYSQAVDRAHELMADESFLNELERIYSPKNKQAFYGMPVHYMINVGSKEYANELIKLLVSALYSNKRLLSTKYVYIDDFGNSEFYRIDDVKNAIKNYYGLANVFQLPYTQLDGGNILSRDSFDIDDLVDSFRKKHNSNLFIFVCMEENNFSKKLLAQITKDADIINIDDSKCSKGEALSLLKLLLDANDIKHYKRDITMPKKEEYTTRDVADRLLEIKRDSVKNYAYKAYINCKTVTVEKEANYTNYYDELQKMIGLDKVKSLVTQIIDSYRINKIRSELGLDVSRSAMHMIFTGNPGSAKTTVARLLTKILYDEGIIRNGKIVECGRQDLVGKYVGWTANIVKDKFNQARNGVLFIDEAYSLVEEHNLYGTEAINTIVQMMENYRDNVIVIFAGYPDKMKTFLDQNEGLRSRIAFHIDFPDYNSSELYDIMKLMSEQRGYVIDESARDKCIRIFENACRQEEFGNGRFARNVLEQAVMRQSTRLSTSAYSNKKLEIDDYKCLNADDFEVNAAEMYSKPQKATIGFAS